MISVNGINNPTLVLEPKHLEFVALSASGYTDAEIAREKFVATITAHKVLQQARNRVGAKNTTHLCVLCLESGVIRSNGEGGYVPVQEERVVG